MFDSSNATFLGIFQSSTGLLIHDLNESGRDVFLSFSVTFCPDLSLIILSGAFQLSYSPSLTLLGGDKLELNMKWERILGQAPSPEQKPYCPLCSNHSAKHRHIQYCLPVSPPSDFLKGSDKWGMAWVFPWILELYFYFPCAWIYCQQHICLDASDSHRIWLAKNISPSSSRPTQPNPTLLFPDDEFFWPAASIVRTLHLSGGAPCSHITSRLFSESDRKDHHISESDFTSYGRDTFST